MPMLAKRETRCVRLREFVAELRAAFGETIDDAVARGKAAGDILRLSNGRTVGHVRWHTYSVQPTSIINQQAPNGFMHAETEHRNERFNSNDS